MSDSRYYNRDDVESYRSRQRDIDRHRHRGGRSPSPSPPPLPSIHETSDDAHTNGAAAAAKASSERDRYQLERAQRMARLRQEMKEEDLELAALDERNNAPQEDSAPKPQEEIIQVNQEELEGLDEEEQMRKLLGFDGFGSTKGEAVKDNQSSAARGVAAKNKARKYRQYMNRKNGFNRPLEKMG